MSTIIQAPIAGFESFQELSAETGHFGIADANIVGLMIFLKGILYKKKKSWDWKSLSSLIILAK